MSRIVPARQRLIFALDVSTAREAHAWIERLGDSVAFYKIGLELLTSGDYFRVLDYLAEQDKRIFVDLKFHDVPATVGHAVRGLARFPVDFCTIHGQQPAMMRAAAEAAGAAGAMKILAVTVLTSMDAGDLSADGITRSPAEQVLTRAQAAQAAGCHGVIASGQEAASLRAARGKDFLIVCPGIRPNGPGGDDQKRTVGVAAAFANGADYIVVGRPIRQAADPRLAADALVDEIEAAVPAA
ncbi:orotidine-5'-phosphate decarboxylase [Aquimonas sp.]|jgi:orotidine-5'-phosphate decarboxylase|uniref:orotidine-5'-phosphate decarboxylase n=1 Tax=Aquimonas sp. TaxID=1872588 RepID=UPI0037BE3EFF